MLDNLSSCRVTSCQRQRKTSQPTNFLYARIVSHWWDLNQFRMHPVNFLLTYKPDQVWPKIIFNECYRALLRFWPFWLVGFHFALHHRGKQNGKLASPGLTLVGWCRRLATQLTDDFNDSSCSWCCTAMWSLYCWCGDRQPPARAELRSRAELNHRAPAVGLCDTQELFLRIMVNIIICL